MEGEKRISDKMGKIGEGLVSIIRVCIETGGLEGTLEGLDPRVRFSTSWPSRTLY
ncbi:hypothetical protein WN55_04572 [Dufourea novaeangliae]|uniref:Uncharacterized protein n=1 Tax=Dufourea novaeangliae TaxID=178035 RepID=A0A154P1D1_DUFNO|nr:hypothetical protein WN55_04572 [Dufourea novaeangliae]